MIRTTCLRCFLLVPLLAGLAYGEPPDVAMDHGETSTAPADRGGLLGAALRALDEADGYSVQISANTRVSAEGMKQEFATTHTLARRNPNQFAWRQIKGMPSLEVVSDGSTLFTLIPSIGRYTQQTAPSDFEALLESDALGLAQSFGAPFLQLFLSGTAIDEVAAGDVRDQGEETIDNTALRRVRFTADDLQWDAWIEPGTPPALRRLRPDMSETIREAKTEMGIDDLELETLILFTDWRIEEELPADTFAFTAPDGAEKVDELFDPADDMEADSSADLIGEAAPDFTLDRLEGGTAALAAHRGKDVVLLDFWATWCPPCVKALPQLIAVATEFKEKGLVFYAVNVREDEERVKTFLERHGHSLNVLMDRDGAVADQFKVSGIPQTVLVDREGVVRKVHVGLVPNLEQRLRTEVEELLAPAGKQSP